MVLRSTIYHVHATLVGLYSLEYSSTKAFTFTISPIAHLPLSRKLDAESVEDLLGNQYAGD
jgi:hypothetical protein